jgi:hypothetical protein
VISDGVPPGVVRSLGRRPGRPWAGFEGDVVIGVQGGVDLPQVGEGLGDDPALGVVGKADCVAEGIGNGRELTPASVREAFRDKLFQNQQVPDDELEIACSWTISSNDSTWFAPQMNKTGQRSSSSKCSSHRRSRMA